MFDEFGNKEILQLLRTKLQNIKGSEQIQEVIVFNTSLGSWKGTERSWGWMYQENPRFVTNYWKIPTIAVMFNMPELVFVFV